MLKHFCAALCLCLLPFAALGEEVLDLSQFEDAPEAAEWEERACISARTEATGGCWMTVP